MAELAVGGWRLTGAEGGKPRVAVHKFSSCDGCQLAILCLEDELLDLASAVDIAWFLEARSQASPGPWDISLVEGSITSEHDVERIREVRAQSAMLVAIGGCAVSGGIQALRNWGGSEELYRAVYPRGQHEDPWDARSDPGSSSGAGTGLLDSSPISDHVRVDLELTGCPVNKLQILEVVASLLIGRKPDLPEHAVCVDCKREGNTCVMVAQDVPCLGPVTRSGCGALCPSFHRGCYGCFGPFTAAQPDELMSVFRTRRRSADEIARMFRGFSGWAPSFRGALERLEKRR